MTRRYVSFDDVNEQREKSMKSWTVCIEVDVKAETQEEAWKLAEHIRQWGYDNAKYSYGDLFIESATTLEPEEYIES